VSLATPVRAIYENGLLRPLQSLPLSEHQEVVIFVTAEERPRAVGEKRLREMHAQADAWLARQPVGAVRQPRPLSPAHQARLNSELDRLLAEVDAAMGNASEDEIAALVDEAANAARRSA